MAGPTEATVTGNAAIALSAFGKLDCSENIKNIEHTEYLPSGDDLWSKYDEIYKNIILKAKGFNS